jgi:hypothetical protein
MEELSRECTTESIQKMIDEIESIQSQINEAVKKINNEKTTLNKEKQKAIKKIKDFKAEVLKQIDTFEKESIQNIEKALTEYVKKTETDLSEAKRRLSMRIDCLESVLHETEPSMIKIFEIKECQLEITETREALHKLKIQIPEIEFLPNDKLLNLLSETKSLGACQLNFRRDPTMLYEIAEKRETRVVPEKSNNNCNITGLVVLADGSVLLADRSNKKLIRLGADTYAIKNTIKFSSEPWAVCTVNSTEAVVSFPEEQKNIKFINVTNKIKVSRTMKLRHTCRGVAFDGNVLLVTDQGVFIYVYKLDGTLLTKFSKDGHAESQLTDFYAIAVRDDLIVVADWNEGLLAFDTSGKLIWKQNDPDLKRPSGVCFDETGNILACGSQSINVKQINREGKKIGEVANTSNGLVYPTSLWFDIRKSLLIVSQQEANTVVYRVR